MKTPDVLTQKVTIMANGVPLEGDLTLLENALGMVIFVHGSGSSRLSPRNQQVARYLNAQGFSTLLFDLLTDDENEVDQLTMDYRFDIPLLSKRIEGTVDWLLSQPSFRAMKIGLFGASTGAAAALVCAANRVPSITAVVSRGGRPDLAGTHLEKVLAPTLLIVGSHDSDVLKLNKQAGGQLRCENRLAIVEGASHLFTERGTLDEVCHLAAAWFSTFMQD